MDYKMQFAESLSNIFTNELTQKQILDLLKYLKEKFNMSVLLITHDLRIVKKYADNIVVVRNGNVIEKGSCKEIFSNPFHEYTKLLINTKFNMKNRDYS